MKVHKTFETNIVGPNVDTVVDVDNMDRVTVEVVFSDPSTAAVVEMLLNYTGSPGDGIAFGTAATFDKTTVRRTGLDVQDAPYIEFKTNTVGSSGVFATAHIYAYKVI